MLIRYTLFPVVNYLVDYVPRLRWRVFVIIPAGLRQKHNQGPPLTATSVNKFAAFHHFAKYWLISRYSSAGTESFKIKASALKAHSGLGYSPQFCSCFLAYQEYKKLPVTE